MMTSIGRWDPFRERGGPREAVDRFLGEGVVWPGDWAAGRGDPALDVTESADSVTVRAALPGYRPEEIEIDLLGDVLTIRAARRSEEEHAGRNYLIRERGISAVSRALILPCPVDADKGRATYEYGELLLTLPKTEDSKPRRIPLAGQEGRRSSGDAYRYGYDAGRSERYRAREFEEAEGELRGEYERRERGAGRGIGGLWERLRSEIRAGWNRARGK